jgi:hypothetical protein
MASSLTVLIYLIAGLAIVYLFLTRRKKLGELSISDIPEMDDEGFRRLVILLKTAYERMFYLGVVFFPLAYASYSNSPLITKLFFLALILLLFFANIPPRNKIMRLLDDYGLTIEDLKARGINL